MYPYAVNEKSLFSKILASAVDIDSNLMEPFLKKWLPSNSLQKTFI